MARHALLIGIERYEDPKLLALRSPVPDMDRLATVLADPLVGAFDKVDQLVDASVTDVKVWLEESLGELGPEDFVLVYLSCHGVVDQRGNLYFAGVDTKLAAVEGSGIDESFVDRQIRRCRAAGKVLLLDSCFSGKFGNGQSKAAHSSPLRRSSLFARGSKSAEDPGRPPTDVAAADPGRGFVTITACNEFEYAFEAESTVRDNAMESAFTATLLETLADPGTDTDEDGWLSSSEIYDAVVVRMRERGAEQSPMYIARTQGTLRIAKAQRRPSVDRVFFGQDEPAGHRGIMSGRHFTGRKAVLTDLVGAITQPGDNEPARLLIGNPGSGKSAVMARIVTLADRASREELPETELAGLPVGTVPPVGCVDVAIHARDRTAAEIAARIGAAVAGGKDAETVLRRLFSRERTADRPCVTILIDAADEAADPLELANSLLRRLFDEGPRHGVRLIVAARSGTPMARRFADARVTDLDDPVNITRGDIASYATKVLLDDSSGTGRDSAWVTATSEAIADRAAGSFLIARLLAAALALAPGPVSRDELKQLPGNVGRAMDKYLYEIAGELRRRGQLEVPSDEIALGWLTDLLLPLTCVRGQGMPDDVLWAKIATAVGVREYSAHHVRILRDSSAGALLRESAGDGAAPTWVLFHQALAEGLRTNRPEGAISIDQQLHRAFVAVLLDAVSEASGVAGRHRARAYALSYLHLHARETGMIGGLLAEVEYLAHADRAAVRQIASYPEAGHLKNILDEVAGHESADDPEVRRQLFALASMRYGRPKLAARFATPGAAEEIAWKVRWSTGPSRPGHDDLIWTMVCHRSRDRPVAVTGGRDGRVRVWDVADGTMLHTLGDHDGGVWRVACGDLADGTPIAVTVGTDWVARVWNLDTFELVCAFEEHTDEVGRVVLAMLDERPVAITMSDDMLVIVWDPATGEQLRVLDGHRSAVQHAAVITHRGDPVVVTVGGDAVGMVWELSVDGSLDGPAVDRPGHPSAQGLTKSAGPARGPLSELVGHHSALYSVDCVLGGNRSLAVTAGDDPTILVWDLDFEEPYLELDGHEDEVQGLRCVVWQNHPLVVSCSADGTVRLWSLRDGRCLWTMTGHTDAVNWCMPQVVDGRLLIFSSGEDGTVRGWDVGLKSPLWTLAFPAPCAPFAVLPDGVVVVAYGQEVAVLEPVGDAVYQKEER